MVLDYMEERTGHLRELSIRFAQLVSQILKEAKTVDEFKRMADAALCSVKGK